MSNPTHEIYYKDDNDVVGTAYFLPDGDISISLNNGHFAGIFHKFENWNPGGYALRAINNTDPFAGLDVNECITDDDFWIQDLDDTTNSSWNFKISNSGTSDKDLRDYDEDLDLDLDDSFTLSNNIEDTCNLHCSLHFLYSYTARKSTTFSLPSYPEEDEFNDEPIGIYIKTSEICQIISDRWPIEETLKSYRFSGIDNLILRIIFIPNVGWKIYED